jgi:hypothetical protein
MMRTAKRMRQGLSLTQATESDPDARFQRREDRSGHSLGEPLPVNQRLCDPNRG